MILIGVSFIISLVNKTISRSIRCCFGRPERLQLLGKIFTVNKCVFFFVACFYVGLSIGLSVYIYPVFSSVYLYILHISYCLMYSAYISV